MEAAAGVGLNRRDFVWIGREEEESVVGKYFGGVYCIISS